MLRWEWNSFITTVTLLVCWGRGHQECICCICQQMSWKRLFFKYSIYFFQLFMRCDAEGYCYDYWPYTGKHDLFHGRSLGEKDVKHLCRPLKYKAIMCFWLVGDENNNLTNKNKDIFLSWAFHVKCVCVTSYIIFLAQF